LAAISAASGVAIDTNKSTLAYTNAYVLTNVYLVATTNSGKGTYSTNFYFATNYAGLTNLAGAGLTLSTNLAYNQTTGGWAIVDGTTISGVSNIGTFFGASAYGYGGFDGNMKALDSVSENIYTGSYALAQAYANLNTSSNTWSVNVSGIGGSASASPKNLGTTKAPAYINTSDANVPVAGSGQAVSPTSTNYYTFKGTESITFWKVLP
jgi:hypothetical protein